MELICCSECLAYKEDENLTNYDEIVPLRYGECRRQPPSLDPKTQNGVWPIVWEEEYCLEFVGDDEPEEPELD